jgi:hypothetical protein
VGNIGEIKEREIGQIGTGGHVKTKPVTAREKIGDIQEIFFGLGFTQFDGNLIRFVFDLPD